MDFVVVFNLLKYIVLIGVCNKKLVIYKYGEMIYFDNFLEEYGFFYDMC